MTENEIARQIVDAAYKVHTTLGPGLLESAYEAVLAQELERRGLQIACQHPISLDYEGVRLEVGYRADMVVEDKVITAVKAFPISFASLRLCVIDWCGPAVTLLRAA